jgi:hypothetical protein
MVHVTILLPPPHGYPTPRSRTASALIWRGSTGVTGMRSIRVPDARAAAARCLVVAARYVGVEKLWRKKKTNDGRGGGKKLGGSSHYLLHNFPSTHPHSGVNSFGQWGEVSGCSENNKFQNKKGVLKKVWGERIFNG